MTDKESRVKELDHLHRDITQGLLAAQGVEDRRRQHRMNNLPPRTTEEKAARVKARAKRKAQKLARRRNRR